jgi:flagellar basal body P-ring protein FlgI
VVGKDVRIKPASILPGALTVEVKTTTDVSQPAPVQRNHAVVKQPTASAKEERAQAVSLKPG